MIPATDTERCVAQNAGTYFRVRRIVVNKRLTITEVAEIVGISSKTLARWEKSGKIRRPKRDWRGWRVYEETDLSEIQRFHETLFEVA